MAEEKETKASEAVPVAEVVAEEKAPPPEPSPEAQSVEEKETKEEVTPEVLPSETDAAIQQSISFKEESNLVGDLQEPEKKALDELKQLIQAALVNNEFKPPPPPPPAAPKPEEPKADNPPAVEVQAGETAATEKLDSTEPEAKEPAPSEIKDDEPPAIAMGITKAEELAPPATSEAYEAASEPLKVEETSEVKAVVVDEDGAKTVEAIEETVVAVTLAPTSSEPDSREAQDETVKETVVETEAPASEQPAPAPAPPEAEFIWGVPLLGDEKSDTVLLKFLRARDFRVKDALAMIKNAVIWRKQFGIENLLEEDLAVPELEKVVFYHGQDKESHPVCYNVYGKFQDQELYAKAFGDDDKREKFLRWRIQFLEKGIRQQLNFSPQGLSTMVQVTDLKNVPGPGRKELRQATKKALALLQDNYPEFVAKQIFINVPWWYLAYNRVMSPFFTQRTKSKFVFAGPSKSAETLFRYIAPEHVPVQYGGLSKDNEPDFTTSDAVTEVVIKPSSKHIIELPASEPSLVVWELRVLGWDVSYSAEFVPSVEEAYTVLVQKARKFTAADEPFVKNSFKVGEPGKIILAIDNATTKKKKLLYRSKTKAAADSA